MKGNFHVQFRGEGVAVKSTPYPAPGGAIHQGDPAASLGVWIPFSLARVWVSGFPGVWLPHPVRCTASGLCQHSNSANMPA